MDLLKFCLQESVRKMDLSVTLCATSVPLW